MKFVVSGFRNTKFEMEIEAEYAEDAIEEAGRYSIFSDKWIEDVESYNFKVVEATEVEDDQYDAQLAKWIKAHGYEPCIYRFESCTGYRRVTK